MARSRNFMITENNPKGKIEIILSEYGGIKLAAWQTERGKEGTKHLQCMCVFSSVKTIQQVIKLFPGCHIELMKGTPAQAWDYCTKDDTRIEGAHGTRGEKPKGVGKRSDLQHVKEDIDEGMSVVAVWDNNFSAMARYAGNIGKYMSLKSPRRDGMTMPTIHTFWGITGAGKSHRAMMEAMKADPDFATWTLESGRKFWGWPNHLGDSPKKLIINECYGQIEYSIFLSICDKYPCTVDAKFGKMEIVADEIWLTSNKHPREWYPKNEWNEYNALKRRLEFGKSSISEFTQVYVEAPIPPALLRTTRMVVPPVSPIEDDITMPGWNLGLPPTIWSSAQPLTTQDARAQFDPFYSDIAGTGPPDDYKIYVDSEDDDDDTYAEVI